MAWQSLAGLGPHAGALALAILLDALLGDPVYPWHPVRLFGLIIQRFEKDLYVKSATPGYYLLSGGFLVMGVLSLVGTSYALLAFVIQLIYDVQGLFYFLGIILEGLLIYQLLAARCLWDEGSRISKVMATGNLEKARKEIGYLVSRDTKDLSPQSIYKAAVETLTENITDAIVAPVLAYSMFGLVGLALYKAINTMDSMIAYKNERYLYFGRIAARLDDLANFVPARISALLIVLTSVVKRDNYKASAKCFIDHRRFHSSPNAGCTESALAGALNIQLSGPTTYFGKVTERPFIGFVAKPIDESHLSATMTYVVYATIFISIISLLFIVFF